MSDNKEAKSLNRDIQWSRNDASEGENQFRKLEIQPCGVLKRYFTNSNEPWNQFLEVIMLIKKFAYKRFMYEKHLNRFTNFPKIKLKKHDT